MNPSKKRGTPVATVSLELQEFYRQQVGNLSGQAKNYAQTLLLTEALQAGDWETLARLILEILEDVNATFAPLAGEAAELYLEAIATSAGQKYTPGATHQAAQETLEKYANQIIRQTQAPSLDLTTNKTPELTIQDIETAASKLGESSKYTVDRAGFETLTKEMTRNNRLYARVPSGRETCGFCTMLASRGFVYSSAEKATSYHRHCDCIIVPGYPGLDVEGYNPDALYRQYEQAQKTVNSLDLRESWAKMTPTQQARYSGSYRRYRTQQMYRVLAGKPAVTY